MDYCDALLSPFPQHNSRYTPEAYMIMVVNEHYMLRRVLPLLMSHPKKFTLVIYHTDYDIEPQVFECLRHKVDHIYAEGCRITHPLITKVPSMNITESIPKHRDATKTIKCYLPKIGLFEENNLHHLPGRLLRLECLSHFEKVPFVEMKRLRYP